MADYPSNCVTNLIEQKYDSVIEDIAEYVCGYDVIGNTLNNSSSSSNEDESNKNHVMENAFLSLFDSIGCGFKSLKNLGCTKLLGPVMEGGVRLQHGIGSRVIGTDYQMDPIQAAFNIGCMNRYLDFNDCFLGAEWCHPSDNLAAILSVAEYVSNENIGRGKRPLTMGDVLVALIKCYEIQGILALDNSFNRIGLDHVILVKIASTAICTQLLGGSKLQIMNAISNAWIDGHPLRTYRQYPNTGSRKGWAAGDACSRAVRLSMISMTGEQGYPTCLTAPKYGFYDVYMSGKPFIFNQRESYGTYVMENILFKVLYPAEYHAQSAIECAIKLHNILMNSEDGSISGNINSVESIEISTHESALRIIDKKGILRNPSDRDHCIQFLVAIALIYGNVTYDHYQDQVAIKDTRIDLLREKMTCVENVQYSLDYSNPDKRSIANAITITFKDGTKHHQEVEYPIGHPRRRDEAIPLLKQKFINSLSSTHFTSTSIEQIIQIYENPQRFNNLSVLDFMNVFTLSPLPLVSSLPNQ